MHASPVKTGTGLAILLQNGALVRISALLARLARTQMKSDADALAIRQRFCPRRIPFLLLASLLLVTRCRILGAIRLGLLGRWLGQFWLALGLLGLLHREGLGSRRKRYMEDLTTEGHFIEDVIQCPFGV